MSPRSGILAGGNWIVDKLKFIDTYPQQDSLANILSESVSNGGGPFNVLMDLAKLGVTFPLAGVGLIGDDPEGEWIKQQCISAGIDITGLKVHSKAHTSYTDVMIVQSTGRRTFFHQRGANAFLHAEHFDFTASRHKIFYLGYLLLLDLLDQSDEEMGTLAAKVVSDARAAGLKTSIDVVSEDSHRFAHIVSPVLPHVDYCILNEFEIERTTGISTQRDGKIDLKAVQAASQELLKAGVKEWVIVHFPDGACAMDHSGKFTVQGSVLVPQEKIVSTVGAGDAFASGVLLGLHEDSPIETALSYGITAAAACLHGSGTSNGILPLADCLLLRENWGSRILL